MNAPTPHVIAVRTNATRYNWTDRLHVAVEDRDNGDKTICGREVDNFDWVLNRKAFRLPTLEEFKAGKVAVYYKVCKVCQKKA